MNIENADAVLVAQAKMTKALLNLMMLLDGLLATSLLNQYCEQTAERERGRKREREHTYTCVYIYICICIYVYIYIIYMYI